MIFSSRANDICIYKQEKRQQRSSRQKRYNALQYTGAGMDTERVDRAYTWHNANDNDWRESALESNVIVRRFLIN